MSSVYLRLSQLSQLFFMQYMGFCVISAPIFLMMIVYFIMLTSPNRKYDPFAIVKGQVRKQWYVLCVFLYS